MKKFKVGDQVTALAEILNIDEKAGQVALGFVDGDTIKGKSWCYGHTVISVDNSRKIEKLKSKRDQLNEEITKLEGAE